MTDHRKKAGAEPAPQPDDRKKAPRGQDEKTDRPKDGSVDEGLDETFPASDPPTPSRPTGQT